MRTSLIALTAYLIITPIVAFAGGSLGDGSTPVKVSRSTPAAPYIRLTDPVTGRPLWLPEPLNKTSKTPGTVITPMQVYSKPGPAPAECQDPSLSAPELVMLERLGTCPVVKTSTRR